MKMVDGRPLMWLDSSRVAVQRPSQQVAEGATSARRLRGSRKEPPSRRRSPFLGGHRARTADIERLKGVALVKSYSALTKMGNAELAEQLKIYKLLEKRTGFKTTGTGPDPDICGCSCSF